MRTNSGILALAVTLSALALGAAVAAQPARRVPARPSLRAAAVMPSIAAPRLGSARVAAAPRRPFMARPVVRRGRVLRASMAPTSPVVTVLQRMETTLQYTRFSPDNRVDPLMGHYELDAPGLVTWVLRRATPAAHRALFAQVRARSPTARDYHDFLAVSPESSATGEAWQRLSSVGALRAGDVVAWRRPPGTHNGGTHVAFVVATPVRTPAAGGGWLVRVTDSTAVPHDNDTRGPQSRHHSGLGTGTLFLGTDSRTDAAVSYGWVGARTTVLTRTSVALGRPLR